MKREPVTSTNLASVGYDKETEQLEIEFHSGSVYLYSYVPERIYDGLMQARSHGSYFHANVKDMDYPWEKVSSLVNVES